LPLLPIDELWLAWHVDRQVREALDHVLQDDAFVSLVRKRIPQITSQEVRKSLRRANISVIYPSLFPALAHEVEKTSQPASGQEDEASEVSVPRSLRGPKEAAATLPGTEPITRRQFQTTKVLFEMGRLKAGQPISIRGRENSTAGVVDGKTVEFRGESMSYLAWGKKVTGWQAVQIYTLAITADGRTLDELRDQPQRGRSAPPGAA